MKFKTAGRLAAGIALPFLLNGCPQPKDDCPPQIPSITVYDGERGLPMNLWSDPNLARENSWDHAYVLNTWREDVESCNWGFLVEANSETQCLSPIDVSFSAIPGNNIQVEIKKSYNESDFTSWDMQVCGHDVSLGGAPLFEGTVTNAYGLSSKIGVVAIVNPGYQFTAEHVERIGNLEQTTGGLEQTVEQHTTQIGVLEQTVNTSHEPRIETLETVVGGSGIPPVEPCEPEQGIIYGDGDCGEGETWETSIDCEIPEGALISGVRMQYTDLNGAPVTELTSDVPYEHRLYIATNLDDALAVRGFTVQGSLREEYTGPGDCFTGSASPTQRNGEESGEAIYVTPTIFTRVPGCTQTVEKAEMSYYFQELFVDSAMVFAD
ncbi:MAG: hypothetical protein KJ600_03540 [Nanoarchaeota archaeon]|nr:hypothetical protein [Nanoarchaeota archaeon]MBU1103601.1 hypothetical protein [Nanoarchaeota archaeon]